MFSQKIKNEPQRPNNTQPKLLSYIVCFFNPVPKSAVQDSLNRAQVSLDRADDLIKKSDDTNAKANQLLSEISLEIR